MSAPAIVREIEVALPRLRGFAKALAGPIDGEDLAQATLERALTRTHLYEPGTKIESWLFRIAQNLHINGLKAARQREISTDPTVLAETAGSANENVEATMLLRRVSDAIDALPAEQRIALTAIALDGQSYSDAANTLGLEAGTVASRVGRARTTLRRLFSDSRE